MNKHTNAGRVQSSEHIAKRVESTRKTKEAWTEEFRNLVRKRNSIAHMGKVMPEEQKKRQSEAMKGQRCSLGVKRSLEFRKHLSEYWKDNPNHNFRIDGKGFKRHKARNTIMSRLEYRLWREAVLKRDSYSCQFCGQAGEGLHVDHIKPYILFPELRFDVDNGRTLCESCHKTTDTYAWKLVNAIRKHGGHKACRQAWQKEYTP